MYRAAYNAHPFGHVREAAPRSLYREIRLRRLQESSPRTPCADSGWVDLFDDAIHHIRNTQDLCVCNRRRFSFSDSYIELFQQPGHSSEEVKLAAPKLVCISFRCREIPRGHLESRNDPSYSTGVTL